MDRTAPIDIPVRTPRAVVLRHHTESRKTGVNDDPATANAQVTINATPGAPASPITETPMPGGGTRRIGGRMEALDGRIIDASVHGRADHTEGASSLTKITDHTADRVVRERFDHCPPLCAVRGRPGRAAADIDANVLERPIQSVEEASRRGLLTIGLALFTGQWTWVWLVAPLTLAAIGCQLAVGNIVSVLTPLRLPREGTDVFAQSTEQGCLAIVSQTVSFFAIGILLVPPASAVVLAVEFGRALAPWIAAVIAIGWGLGLYLISLYVAGRLLRRRMPEVLAWVQVV